MTPVQRLSACLAILVIFQSQVEAAQLTHGPLVFRVLPKRATIWVRTNGAAEVDIEYSTSPTFATFATRAEITTKSRDSTGVIHLTGLDPETTYYYRVYVDGVRKGGVRHFRTAPKKGKRAPVRIAVLADSIKPQRAPVLETAVDMDPDFICFIGDLGHDEPANLNQMRLKWRQQRANATPFGTDFKRLLINSSPFRQIPFYFVWDDHDFGTNNADRRFAMREDALKAYKEYFYPTSRADPNGIWQKYSYGRNVDVFLLDLRSNRDPNDLPDGPEKTMLGQAQKDWLKVNLLSSKSRWKLLMTTVPFNPETKPFDAWGSFLHERQELLDFIAANDISGVVLLSGDIHSGGGMDDGTNSDLPEVSVPHLNMTGPVDTWALADPPTPGVWTTGLLTGKHDPGFVLCDVATSHIDITIRNREGDIKRGKNGTLLRMVIGSPPAGTGEIGIAIPE